MVHETKNSKLNHKAPKNQMWLFEYTWIYNLEFNKNLLYYRENVVATVYINI